MIRRSFVLMPLVVSLLLMGCASSVHVGASPESAPAIVGAEWMRVQLHFGMSSPDGAGVSEQQWKSFEGTTLLAAFPQGFTTTVAEGRWRDEQGRLIGERSRVVAHVFEGARLDAMRREVGRVARLYKQRFRQEAVLVTWSPVRVDFL